MLVIGIILSIFGVGLFCWVIFTLAVYALPFLSRLLCVCPSLLRSSVSRAIAINQRNE
jgi:hypothetical protein